MKTAYCKDRRCDKLSRHFNASCLQFNGSFYCRLAKEDIKTLAACPLEASEEINKTYQNV